MTLDQLLAAIAALPTVRASEIDGEESDGTPRHWRNRPFVSRTALERLLREHWPHGVTVPRAPEPLAMLRTMVEAWDAYWMGGRQQDAAVHFVAIVEQARNLTSGVAVPDGGQQ